MLQLGMLKDGVVVNRFNFFNGTLAIGRNPTNNVVIQDESVSGYHCRLRIEKNPGMDDTVWLEDANSMNGTHMNDARVMDRCIVGPNDVIKVMHHEFQLIYPNVEETTHCVVPFA